MKINSLKRELSGEEKDFLEEFEPEIHDFFNFLNERGVLDIFFSDKMSIRFYKLIENFRAPISLVNNLNEIFLNPDILSPDNRVDNKLIKMKLDKIDDAGLKLDEKQYVSILVHSHQVFSEKLKLILITFINFYKLKPKRLKKYKNRLKADNIPLGTLLDILIAELPNNKFLNYLNSNERNAIAHYSYIYEDDNLYLFKGFYDTNPKIMSFSDFVLENKNLNILTEALISIFFDKYR